MNSFNAVFPVAPAPMLVALLAGIVFLYRAWRHLSIIGNLQLHPTKSKTFDPATKPDAVKDEAHNVSKEPDFPADWWTGKNVFELERRAIFSKVK
ncbi:hypothetical protein EYZ11_000894 [Aspergillus tanneri]|uniref:Uncharacterized protein n=1 Tax=Aspergillus tanneri TaxID=1220188 RepID=A0A4S3JW32_9EURO|nr:hypothetical protein EYZ11_000894 [Aspergillus tanneri]